MKATRSQRPRSRPRHPLHPRRRGRLRAIQRLGAWLGSIDGVKGLVVLGHAGEGTFLTAGRAGAVIEAFIESIDGRIPVIAGITLEGTKVAARGSQARR